MECWLVGARSDCSSSLSSSPLRSLGLDGCLLVPRTAARILPKKELLRRSTIAVSTGLLLSSTGMSSSNEAETASRSVFCCTPSGVDATAGAAVVIGVGGNGVDVAGSTVATVGDLGVGMI
uniref:Uncharacterized protein n=1 Tax=Anopheles funestus TaxID=62324 RepID=A0A182S359_ANOFN